MKIKLPLADDFTWTVLGYLIPLVNLFSSSEFKCVVVCFPFGVPNITITRATSINSALFNFSEFASLQLWPQTLDSYSRINFKSSWWKNFMFLNLRLCKATPVLQYNQYQLIHNHKLFPKQQTSSLMFLALCCNRFIRGSSHLHRSYNRHILYRKALSHWKKQSLRYRNSCIWLHLQPKTWSSSRIPMLLHSRYCIAGDI